ncbi:cupin domain-containing protein [Streptomyces sp. NPDC059785]|uniref:cupin domain-containing protein n=1 Tax=Streptomyces sp. NPDC059785 TaxID=3346945 RepID=UPI003669191F
MTAADSGTPEPAGDPGGEPAGDPGSPVARTLCDITTLVDGSAPADGAEPVDGAGEPTGALWRLAEPGRQLDANVVRIPPAGRVDVHTEPDLDVLLLVVAGSGTLLGPGDGPLPLRPGSLNWLPHGAARGLHAGPDGLHCLTVHRRRPGMRVQPRPPDTVRTPPPA